MTISTLFSTARKYMLLPSLTLFATLALSAVPVRAERIQATLNDGTVRTIDIGLTSK